MIPFSNKGIPSTFTSFFTNACHVVTALIVASALCAVFTKGCTVGDGVSIGCVAICIISNSRTVTLFWIASATVLINSPADGPPDTWPPKIIPDLSAKTSFTLSWRAPGSVPG